MSFFCFKSFGCTLIRYEVKTFTPYAFIWQREREREQASNNSDEHNNEAPKWHCEKLFIVVTHEIIISPFVIIFTSLNKMWNILCYFVSVVVFFFSLFFRKCARCKVCIHLSFTQIVYMATKISLPFTKRSRWMWHDERYVQSREYIAEEQWREGRRMAYQKCIHLDVDNGLYPPGNSIYLLYFALNLYANRADWTESKISRRLNLHSSRIFKQFAQSECIDFSALIEWCNSSDKQNMFKLHSKCIPKTNRISN